MLITNRVTCRAQVESKSYAGGFRTQLKGPEPQSARQARDHILNIMDSGQRYRFFTFLNEGIRTVYSSDRMSKDINDFAQNIEVSYQRLEGFFVEFVLLFPFSDS